MKNNIILLIAAALILILPLYLHHSKENIEFAGADTQAEAVIQEIRPDYQPWFESLWSPPSGEIESMLFAMQAAAGAGLFCFGLGWMMARSKYAS